MRTIFQKWLFIFIVTAFALTFAFSFYFQTEQSEFNAAAMIRLKIEDVRRQLRTNNRNIIMLRELISRTALAKARMLAEMIAAAPSLIEDDRKLRSLVSKLDIDELHISDEKGILVATTSRNKGYDMSLNPQSAEFMPALSNPRFELIQYARSRGADKRPFQYAGVARIDKPGIILLGYYPNRLTEALEVTNPRNLAAGFRIGTNGRILLCNRGFIISSIVSGELGCRPGKIGIPSGALYSNQIFFTDIAGERHIGVAESDDSNTIIGLLPIQEMYISRNALLFFLILCNLILFGVVFILVSELVQRIVINGIQKVNASLKKITDGDLEEKVNVRNNTEFVALSGGINATVEALKSAIALAEGRINAELEFAQAIQHSALPNIFPPYPGRHEFDIFASMLTAKEVGGDFYDFFMPDEKHLAFLVADVSGKGIGAALFMMNAKSRIKSLAESGLSPAELIAAANRGLCENNDTGMFVTAFFAVLNLESGILTCVNAGHNPPLLQPPNGKFDYLRLRPGLALGVLDSSKYRQEEIAFAPGGRIFLYTDGVTEAQNPAKTLFGESRLKEMLNQPELQGMPWEHLLPEVKRRIDLFADGAEQFDDITMLGVTFQERMNLNA